MLGVGSLTAGGGSGRLYCVMEWGAVYGDHATVRVALPVFVAVYVLPGVALFPFAVDGGLVLCVVPMRYCPSDAAAGNAFVGVGC